MLRKKPPHWWNKCSPKGPAHSRLLPHLVEVCDSLPRYSLELLAPRLRIPPVGDQQDSSRLRDPYHLSCDPPGYVVVCQLQEHHRFHGHIERLIAKCQPRRIGTFKTNVWVHPAGPRDSFLLDIYAEEVLWPESQSQQQP